MRIAVDAQSTQGARTGIGHAGGTLLAAMKAAAPEIEWLYYTRRADRDLNTPRRILWESAEIPLRLLKDKPDLIYSPGFSPAVVASVPRVVTVHDLIGMTFAGNQRTISSFYWGRWLPAMLKRSNKLVAISEATRRDIERLLGVPASRVEVVPDAADPRYRKLSDPDRLKHILDGRGIDRPYFLTVSTSEPRKNLMSLIRAFEALPDAVRRAHLLVIAGKQGIAGDALRLHVRHAKLEEEVRFLGYVPDEELVYLYNGCLGYAFVSLAEGFGLPPLEAMSCGKSGVVSNASALPEVTGDTALSVDPLDTAAISAALERYATDRVLRTELELKAYERARLFSAERSAQKMIQIFKDVHRRS